MTRRNIPREIEELINMGESRRSFVLAGLHIVEHATRNLERRGVTALPQATEIQRIIRLWASGDKPDDEAAPLAWEQVSQVTDYDAATCHLVACHHLVYLLKYYTEGGDPRRRTCHIADCARNAVAYARSGQKCDSLFNAAWREEGLWQIKQLRALLAPPLATLATGARLRNSLLAC